MTAKPDEADSADTQTEPTDKPTLEQLLESWDKKVDSEAKPDSNLAREVARLSYKLEMKDIIGKVRGDLPVSDEFVETYVNMRADRDSRLQKLWDNRDDNREAFNEAMSGLSKDFVDFAKKNGFQQPESEESDDKGLGAAARIARETNSSGSSMDDVEWGSLSDSDLALKKREVFRLAKAGKL